MNIEDTHSVIILQQEIIISLKKLKKVRDDVFEAQAEVIMRQADLIEFYEKQDKEQLKLEEGT